MARSRVRIHTSCLRNNACAIAQGLALTLVHNLVSFQLTTMRTGRLPRSVSMALVHLLARQFTNPEVQSHRTAALASRTMTCTSMCSKPMHLREIFAVHQMPEKLLEFQQPLMIRMNIPNSATAAATAPHLRYPHAPPIARSVPANSRTAVMNPVSATLRQVTAAASNTNAARIPTHLRKAKAWRPGSNTSTVSAILRVSQIR